MTHETVIPGTIRYSRCSRCGAQLVEVRSIADYDLTDLCPSCRKEKAHADDLAEARQEVLDWVDTWLAQRISVSKTLRDSLWEAGMQKFDLQEEQT